MKIDLDTYREILDTLTRNKGRSLLTGFGVFWGVFMLVVLIGGGRGLKELLERNFEGFANNAAFVWSQNTTKAYKGMKKGRYWWMDNHDVERIQQRVPELDVVTPILFGGSKQAVQGDNYYDGFVLGVMTEMQKVQAPKMAYGRYLNEMDITQLRKVCVIGKKVYQNLFPKGGDPCGQMVRIDKIYYEVVGVDVSESNGMNFGGPPDESMVIPFTLMQKTYNQGNSVHMIAMTAHKGVTMSALTQKIRQTIARAHLIDETDEQGIMVFNTELLFGMMDSLFQGVNFLVWLVGIGTLLAGAIGVSNIMMVTVKERTTEIGIRRAIGATPKSILSQIIAESIVLTLVAGMSGILFAVAILQMVELGNTTDGILLAHFQVPFNVALAAVLLVSLLGALAGMPPALRAMSIKPVDAMRDE